MKQHKLIQYLSLSRYVGLKKIINKLDKKNINIILDMEDSAQDLFDEENNLAIKQNCRQGLEYLFEEINHFKNEIFIRINSISSSHFKKDIDCIKKLLNDDFKITGIFLPKVENLSEVILLKKMLNKNKLKFIPIIETFRGLSNLEKILDEDKDNLIYAIHYGHFDYCYDMNLWPYPEPFHFEYWKIIFYILNITSKKNKIYVQTPYPLLKNDKFFWSSLKYINKNYPNQKIWLSLVNFNPKLILEPKKIFDLNLKYMSKDLDYKKNFANKIINTYLELKTNKKSFTLDSKRFIPPHQYLSAKKFISNNDRK